MRNALLALCFAASAVLPGLAHAWSQADWSHRTRVSLNTSASGLPTQEALSNVTVAVRLHSGNFDFTSSKEDGSDLLVLAADDKTPLKFAIERFDGINELAVLWVQLPSVLPGSDKNSFYVYGGNAKASSVAVAPAEVFDASTLALLHFADAKAEVGGALSAAKPPLLEQGGLLGASAKLQGEVLAYSLAEPARKQLEQALTLSLWFKSDASANATLLRSAELALSLQDGQLQLQAGSARLSTAAPAAGRWTALAVRAAQGKLELFVDGKLVAQAEGAVPKLAESVEIGAGLKGQFDALQLAASARSNDWLALNAAAQGAESKLLTTQREDAAAAEAGEPGYMGILVKNLTIDAWVVIVILGVMFVIACWVMWAKTLLVGKMDKANRQFLRQFRDAGADLLKLHHGEKHPNSPLYRLYEAGVRELDKRKVGQDGAPPLSGASLDAVKASVDADYVRETATLNSGMVLLTIAISGGPFLGLLGTVVGVMITFAAIAAAGDVNVNAIAPGIAAALLATVAGLAVAIPALFGYNYLAARIKNISADMQIFIDEFITRVAELYGAR